VNRRAFAIALAAALAAPLVAPAQPRKIYRIGLLECSSIREPLRQGFRDLGYAEGQNLSFVDRESGGRTERLADLAAEIVRLNVDIIVTYGTVATLAAKQATTTIPIVMTGVGDPIGAKLVARLGHPGGNVTGNTILGPEVGPKRLQLLKEAIPALSRVAFLWNPTNASNALHFHEVKANARGLGITLQSIEVSAPNQFEAAFAAMTRERPDALILTADPTHQLHSGRVVEFAAKTRIPAMYVVRENVSAGGLMSYGASLPDLSRRAAVYVDKILKGTKAGDLPIEQPTTFQLVINLKTATSLGLTIPPSLLLRADQVIE